jgi:hypothetical protein
MDGRGKVAIVTDCSRDDADEVVAALGTGDFGTSL